MKYIDAEKLIAEIDKLESFSCISEEQDGFYSAISRINGIIDSLQQEYPDIDKIKREWHNKGYLKGRKEANIPARELGLPKSCDVQEQPEVNLVEEITDKSRACCNCINGVTMYPNCYCWQHKHCNTDEPYKISTEDWVETAKTCTEFEFELGLNARKEE